MVLELLFSKENEIGHRKEYTYFSSQFLLAAAKAKPWLFLFDRLLYDRSDGLYRIILQDHSNNRINDSYP